MGISTDYLPDSSPQIQYAYDWSIDIVNQDLQCALSQSTSWTIYERAVYNLAGHTLIEWATDQSYPLAALSWSAGVATGQTTAASAIIPGDRVRIVAVSPLGYAGPPNLGYVVVQATPDPLHFQYNLSPDPGAATLLSGAAVAETFFQQARSRLKLGEFAPGVVASASDVSTSTGLLNQDFMRGLTLENLQLLKTVYGRAYMSIAQKYGPTVWGVT